MENKQRGKVCPKCGERDSFNFSNKWSTDKTAGGVEMHWCCNKCGETFIK